MGRRVALVEDEAAIRENYRAVLSRQGYDVDVYDSRHSAMAAFRQRLPELAVIDVGLGEEIEGGFDLCRELRTMAPRLPIIFLTARDDEIDAITGLRLGADDYLTKDISSAHIVARIVALFRRIDALREAPEEQNHLECGDLKLDGDCMEARWRGEAVKLTLTEFWLVNCLARHPGHVKNRQQLMDAANVVLDDNTITSNIKRVRKKFQVVDKEFNAIETVYGFGYRWNRNV
ncbi:proteobacterial dedicated sortase system response regulator [Aestuariirhabdus sp. Z084]|uniref:proteobacterial dedicated sortase system response regulator n=1 Tax=Aestuariirhabdus haliotis TaxID=2918751 RepID=UPI00201B38C7|nr:proteobacterial dedicated sortase system response regulator [Aestuariirhabdus haliotis]MCL6415263.1 proteobacterial dedicated sortase system response regulator [Aestuariirhabdus haliotis]MCL6419523.1 proteobacterial dedicated sortase system response regulator [Aestuariirhabdus haliotis]